jgi:hypothetical protein
VEDLDDEERDDPRKQLGLGEDVHVPNLPSGAGRCNGPEGLFSGADGPTQAGAGR